MSSADEFTPERWELPPGPAPAAQARKPQGPGVCRRGKFLKGPVPWAWLQRAMLLRGRALAVGLMLWKEAGCTGRRTVHFCLARAAGDGIPTTTARRAVRELERVGLVRVRRKPGSGLEVTLLDTP